MKYELAVFAGLIIAINATGQGNVPATVIPGKADAFTTDELGHIYVLHGDVLELYDMTGKRLARNSVKTFGRISTMDAFYSLKPMVFSRDQRQIATLDNTLSIQGSVIDLSRSGFPWVTLVCAGVQNTFWFFDERQLELVRVDNQMRRLAAIGRLDQLLGHATQPTQLLESDNLLYVNDPHHGVMVFDLFGAWMRTLPIVGAQRIQVRGNMVFHFKDGVLLAYDIRSFETKPVESPAGMRPTDARMERDRIYFLSADGVTVVPMPSP